jgi:hypothetical protein
MREFVCEKLAWSPEQWKQMWELRNFIFHGKHDLSSEQQQAIIGHLPRLEEAVVNALRCLLGLPQDAPPHTLRQRSRFYGAKLHVQWTHNG